MIAVSGILMKKRRFLLCKRPQNVVYGGSWEFPTTEIVSDETAEDALDRVFFENLTANLRGYAYLGGENMVWFPKARVLSYAVCTEQRYYNLNGYMYCKWVTASELERYRLSPFCVTAIKGIKFLNKS